MLAYALRVSRPVDVKVDDRTEHDGSPLDEGFDELEGAASHLRRELEQGRDEVHPHDPDQKPDPWQDPCRHTQQVSHQRGSVMGSRRPRDQGGIDVAVQCPNEAERQQRTDKPGDQEGIFGQNGA